MPRSKSKPKAEPEDEGLKQRKKLAKDWKMYRLNALFTQKRMAEVIGVSRRTIQQVEGGHITPKPLTQRRFAVFKERCKDNEGLGLKP